MDRDQTLKQLEAGGVVAVVRAPSADVLDPLADALITAGVAGIEVTLTTPNAIAGIEKLAARVGDRIVVGVGTVLDADTARKAIDAGARYVVSPFFDESIVHATLDAGALSMPGAFTPTEIMRASRAGADVVKVFPATALGPQYFKDVLAPLPFLKLMPTGGVSADNAGDWVRAGAVCVGAGSALAPKVALEEGNWDLIIQRGEAFVRSVAAARSTG